MTNQNNNQYNAENKSTRVFDLPEGSSIADDVLKQINDQCLKPRSKWYFICKNELFWALGLFSIIIGSVAVAAGLFAVSYVEVDYYTVTHDSLISFLLDTLPLMWLACLLAFILLGYVQIRHTKRGYKYSFVIVVGSTFALSLVGGVVLNNYGFGALLEKAVEGKIPFHNSAFREKEQMWQKAERGVIAGEVVFIENDNSSFVLKDWSGRLWLVNSIDLMEMDISILKENQKIKVIGLPTDMNPDINRAHSMHACFILPWSPTQEVAINNINSQSAIDFQKNDGMMQNSQNFSERNNDVLRSKECKGVRPYQLIERLRAEAK